MEEKLAKLDLGLLSFCKFCKLSATGQLGESASLADVGQCKHLPDPQTERTPAVNNTEGTPTVRQPTNFRTLETRNRAETITEIADTIL